MTKKHFIDVARLLNAASTSMNPVVYALLCRSFAALYATQKTRFNRTKFLEACGVDE